MHVLTTTAVNHAIKSLNWLNSKPKKSFVKRILGPEYTETLIAITLTIVQIGQTSDNCSAVTFSKILSNTRWVSVINCPDLIHLRMLLNPIFLSQHRNGEYSPRSPGCLY